MKKTDLLELIKNAKDEDDINSLLAGTDIEEEFKAEQPTLDVFKQKIKSDKDFKSFMDSEKDSYFTKAIKTMKEKGTWENEFANEMHEKYPDLISDPVQKELLELKTQLANEKAANAKKDLLANAIKYANDKGLKLSSIDRYLGDDLDTTKANIDSLADEWSKALDSAISEKLKESSYIPGGTNPNNTKLSIGASMASENNKTNTKVLDPWNS